MKKRNAIAILTALVCLTFGHTPAAWGAPSCEGVFLKATSAAGSATESKSFWSQLNKSVHEIFADNLISKSTGPMKPYAQVLKKHDEHLDTLRSLKLLSPTNEIASPSKIISRLTKAIDESARKAGLQDPDLLKPAFVFMMPDQTMIWRRWGETIPKDAVSYGGVLPTAEYSQMLRDGFFPVGTSQPTITGLKFTTFEHDLAHLTSFIQYPEYMKAIRDQARLQHESRTIEVEGQHELSYLLGEGLLVVDPSLHLKLGDILQTGPFYRPLAHIDVVEKIRALTPQQLEKLLMFPINDLTHYVHVMGGAGRDPFSRNYVRHNLIEGSIKNAFFDPLMKIRYNEKLEEADYQNLARALTVLDKLSEITLNDWLPVIRNVRIEPNSKIAAAFSKSLWGDELVYPFDSYIVPRATLPNLIDALETVPRDNSHLPYAKLLENFHQFQAKVNAQFKTNEPTHDFLWEFSQMFYRFRVSHISRTGFGPDRTLRVQLRVMDLVREKILKMVIGGTEAATPPAVLKNSLGYLLDLSTSASATELRAILSSLRNAEQLRLHPERLVDALDRVQKRLGSNLFVADELKSKK